MNAAQTAVRIDALKVGGRSRPPSAPTSA